ncbi:MAG: hypothetical protein WCH42_03290 [Actinomycetes bacterium]
MAELVRSGDTIALQLSRWEKVGALHSSPTMDVSQFISLTHYDNLWQRGILRGVRAPGTGLFLFILLGTLRHKGGRDFCAIYKKRPGFVIELTGGEFKRWLFTSDKSEELTKLLFD